MTENKSTPVRRRLYMTGGLLAVLLVLGCIAPPGFNVASAKGPVGSVLAQPQGGLRVEGNRLVADGKPFITRGVQIVGFVAPQRLLQPIYARARERFGAEQFQAAKDFGANLIRFQVSQPGLDPKSPDYDAVYERELRAAVQMALDAGFKIIISLQPSAAGGADYIQPLPSDNTVRAWSNIAPWWKNDNRVMYELYNEPGVMAKPEHWELWLNGGKFRKNPTGLAVGMQKLIETVRATGATNVIIVPGLSGQKSLEGVPTPRDPLNNLAYGFHSPPLDIGRKGWQRSFGYLAGRVPVLMTEWAASAKAPNCETNYPAEATDLLRYLDELKIGVNAFSFDLPGTLLEEKNYKPTNFAEFRCASPGVAGIGGPGELLNRYYSSGAVAASPASALDDESYDEESQDDGSTGNFERHTYKQVEGRDLSLYVLKPPQAGSGARLPAAVFFHGGGWIAGKPGSFAPQAEYLAGRGMVTILVEYRFLSKGSRELPTRPVQDAKSAMRWVRAHSNELGIDPQRIAAIGGSAGGQLAAFTGMVEGTDDPADNKAISPRPNAMVLFNPVLDNGPGGWSYRRTGERYREFSPYHNVSPDDPPSIVFVGDRDKLVPANMLCDFQRQLRGKNVNTTVRIFDGAGHSFFRYGGGANPAYYETLRETDTFLTSLGWLKGPPTLQLPKTVKRSSSIRNCN